MSSYPQVAAFPGDESTIRVVGHRGARGILPENSIIGFDFALSTGVDLLEFDVLLSRDAVPVITAIMNSTARLSGGGWRLSERGTSACDLADHGRRSSGSISPV